MAHARCFYCCDTISSEIIQKLATKGLFTTKHHRAKLVLLITACFNNLTVTSLIELEILTKP